MTVIVNKKKWKKYWEYKQRQVIPDELSFDRIYYEQAEKLLNQPIHSLCCR